MIYFIADTHFYQSSIIPYCKRPFYSVEEMNKTLIDNWNKKVKTNDIVYFLGDFGFADQQKLRDIVNRLNGYKIIILGNHDTNRKKEEWGEIGFDEVYDKEYIFNYIDTQETPRTIILSHKPLYINDKQYNIHGHIHDANLNDEFSNMNTNNHLCVSVEKINYTPISFKEIKGKYLDSFFKSEKGN